MGITSYAQPGIAYKLRNAGLPVQVRGFTDGRPVVIGTRDDAAAQAIIDSYTLKEAKDYMCAEVLGYARLLRDKAVEGVSPAEMACWPIKRAEASDFASRGASAAPILSAEAARRGVSLKVLADKVMANAAALSAIEAEIAGADGRHRDAIGAKTSFADLLAYDWRTGWPAL